MIAPTIGLKAKHDANIALIGGFVFSTDPNIPMIFAESGFDFVVIDMEHGTNGIREVVAHLRAGAAAGINCLVRIGKANYGDAARLLDAGAEGIMIPHLGVVGSGANEVPGTLKFWPEGGRPACSGVFSSAFGLRDFSELASNSNLSVLSVGLVEDRETVENVDSVLDNAKIDWILPGPGDLAASLGVHGQFRHPDVLSAVDKVIVAARQRNMPVGMYVNDASEIPAWREKGASFFIYSLDYKILGMSLKMALSDCRKAVV